MDLRIVATSKCNFKCIYCTNEHLPYNEPLNCEFPKEWVNLLLKAVNTISEIKSITVTGGEPTLHSSFKQLSRILTNTNKELVLVTNGTMIDSNYIKHYEKFDRVTISLHRFDEEGFSYITRANGKLFQKIIEGIKLLRNNYPNKNIRINVVSDEHNSRQIPLYLRLAKEYSLEINVLHEGIPKRTKQKRLPAPLWNIEVFKGTTLDQTTNRKTYKIKSNKIFLSRTSLDNPSWNSIWISPNANVYWDVRYIESPINLKNYFELKDVNYLKNAFYSIVDLLKLRKVAN